MECAVKQLDVSVYVVPTESAESDGTLEWDSTTLVVVEVRAGGKTGLGYTYADRSSAALIDAVLRKVVESCDVFAIPATWLAMCRAVRNYGCCGIASIAIAAVDTALWDLKAKLLGLPLVHLLGIAQPSVPIYGSGGFTSYSPEELCDQLAEWVKAGIPRVKMKIGRQPKKDIERIRTVRDALGPDADLFVDANGAYDRKQALAVASAVSGYGVTWFEEPVTSDDLAGLRLIRDRAPASMEIAAGEYGYDGPYFRRMLEAGAVDVLQADATRCRGITGFLQVASLCETFAVPLSAHTAPSLHLHPCCATSVVRHLEYFYDHVRIERMFFDGVATPSNGTLAPDLSRPGIGLELKRADAQQYAVL